MYIYTYIQLYTILCIYIYTILSIFVVSCCLHHPTPPSPHRKTHGGGDGTDEGREDAHGQEDDPNRKEPGGLAADWPEAAGRRATAEVRKIELERNL